MEKPRGRWRGGQAGLGLAQPNKRLRDKAGSPKVRYLGTITGTRRPLRHLAAPAPARAPTPTRSRTGARGGAADREGELPAQSPPAARGMDLSALRLPSARGLHSLHDHRMSSFWWRNGGFRGIFTNRVVGFKCCGFATTPLQPMHTVPLLPYSLNPLLP